MGTFWRLADLAKWAGIPADADPQSLVNFFEKSGFFTKSGLWNDEVGATSKKKYSFTNSYTYVSSTPSMVMIRQTSLEL